MVTRYILILLVLFSTGCAGMKFPIVNSIVKIVPAVGEVLTKKVGDVSIRLEPAQATYNYLMASDNFITWKFTIDNLCSRVFRPEKSLMTLTVAGKAITFHRQLEQGLYPNYHELKENTSIDYIAVAPNRRLEAYREFLWSYDLKYGYPATIKVGLHDVPVCHDGEFVGYESIEWNFTFQKVEG